MQTLEAPVELWRTIKAAELKLFGMHGKGLGAFLLAIIVLSVIFFGPHLDGLFAFVVGLAAQARSA